MDRIKLKIADMTPQRFLAFDLRDLLPVIEPWVPEATWRVSGLWVTGEDDPGAWQHLIDTRHGLHDEVLMDAHAIKDFAKHARQVIDGCFLAQNAAGDPIVRIEAVDSSYWIVEGCEPLIVALESAFQETSRINAD